MQNHKHITSALIVCAVATGCATTQTPPELPSTDGSTAVKEKIEQGSAPKLPNLIFRAGDSVDSTIRSLSKLDGRLYVLAEGSPITHLPGHSLLIGSRDEVVDYFAAYKMQISFADIGQSKYTRVHIRGIQPDAAKKASDSCNVQMAGTLPFGHAVSQIARKAGIDYAYLDTGAAAYEGVVVPLSFAGNCTNALTFLGIKNDLSVTFDQNTVAFRMMDIATIDLGIPLRDRQIAMDILADGSFSGGGAAGASSQKTTSSGSGGGSKSVQSSYATNYLQSIRSILESTKTGFGTWNYIPETGQVFIRDRAEALAAAKSNINKLSASFQDVYQTTLTFYRMTVNNDTELGSSFLTKINQNLSLSFGTAATIANAAVGATVQSSDGTSQMGLFQALSTYGNIETLDTFTLTLQAGVPQTLKVANNTEYVRNVSVTTTNTTGATSSIEQANATDGSFVTLQVKRSENNRIAVDFGAFINRLDGFDTTVTQNSTVKSQKGFERTFDTMAVVEDGVPYVASVVSQKMSSNTTRSLPGVDSASPFANIASFIAGGKKDTGLNSYIVVVVESRRVQ